MDQVVKDLQSRATQAQALAQALELVQALALAKELQSAQALAQALVQALAHLLERALPRGLRWGLQWGLLPPLRLGQLPQQEVFRQLHRGLIKELGFIESRIERSLIVDQGFKRVVIARTKYY
jgi:hypothetical protein